MSCRRTRQLSRPILSQPLLKSWLGRTPSTFPLSTIHPSVHRCVPIAYTGVNRRDRHLCIRTRPRSGRGTSAAFCDHGKRGMPRSRRTEVDGKVSAAANHRRALRQKSSAADQERSAAKLPRHAEAASGPILYHRHSITRARPFRTPLQRELRQCNQIAAFKTIEIVH